jgi:hypothetical protein
MANGATGVKIGKQREASSPLFQRVALARNKIHCSCPSCMCFESLFQTSLLPGLLAPTLSVIDQSAMRS